MLTDLRKPVSRRGQWRGSYAVVSPNGGTDPSLCTYTINLHSLDDGGHGGFRDYGWAWGCNGACSALRAATDDGTGRLAAVQTDTALVVSWLFPVADVRSLCHGTYEVSIIASLGDETVELVTFKIGVR